MEETRRQQAKRLAAETGLSESNVYKRLQRGDSEAEVRNWGDISREIDADIAQEMRDNTLTALAKYRTEIYLRLRRIVAQRALEEFGDEGARRVMALLGDAIEAAEAEAP